MGAPSLKSKLNQLFADVDKLNALHEGSIGGHLGIEITAIGEDHVAGKMPVDERTRQPHGIMHGGASIVLAETLGSIASYLLVWGVEGARVAGVEVSGSHLRAVSSGNVYGLCKAVHIGRTLHFWQIDIRDDDERLCCAAKLTVSVSLPTGSG